MMRVELKPIMMVSHLPTSPLMKMLVKTSSWLLLHLAQMDRELAEDWAAEVVIERQNLTLIQIP